MQSTLYKEPVIDLFFVEKSPMKRFETNFTNHLIALRSTLIYTTIFIVAVILFRFSGSVGIMITVLLVYTLPAIIVHSQFCFLNRGSAFLVKNEKIFIESKHSYDVKEIEGIIRIDLYAAGGVFKKIEWDAYPVQQYHYIKISTDSEIYYVTSILFDDTIEKRLKQFIDCHDAVYHRHKKIIPFISLS